MADQIDGRSLSDRRVTRRALGRLVALATLSSVGAGFLASCAPAVPPTPTAAPAKPAEKPTEKPAPAPTAAPAKPTEAPKPTAAPAKPTEAPKPTATPAKAAGQVELYWFLPLSAAPEIKIWEGFVERFQKANPNVVIKGSYEPWGDYWVKLQTVMAGGAIPDVIWLVTYYTHAWASKDVMRPLDDLLAADKIDPREYVMIDAGKYKGRIYSIAKDNGMHAVWFNVDKYSKAGAALPTKDTTWDKFLEACKLLTVDQAGRNATDAAFDPTKIAQWGTNPLVTRPIGEGFFTWFWNMGGKLYDDEMKHTLITEPESIEALQFAADLRVKWKVAPLPGAITEPGDPFRIGRVTNTWSHHAMAFYLHEEKRDIKWDEIYYPHGKGGVVISGGYTGFGIPKATKHLEEAWEVSKFMTGEEQQKIIIAYRRWASGRTKLVPLQYEEGYHTPNYVLVHVDPLTGNGPQVRPHVAPAAIDEILQVWDSTLDPVWYGKAQVKDVVKDLKVKIDELLQRPARI